MQGFEPEDSVRAFLAQLIDAGAEDVPAAAADTLGVSRQTIHTHLAEMVKEGLVDATGRTSGRVYKLRILISHEESFEIGPALQEDAVWRKVFAERLAGLNDNVRAICHYGLTEMLNNAVAHSLGKTVRTGLEITPAKIKVWVRDDGVGVFKKVKDGLNLADEREAILELSKGKVTTDPSRHTGEGIFFTSRAFDLFVLTANRLGLVHLAPDDEDDWLIEDERADVPVSGTGVSMIASVWSHRTIQQVFDKFTSGGDVPSFSKTHVPVRLLLVDEENLVSRSQAKRLLARFSRFAEVMLDFEGVSQIGQAFADEVFRVFAGGHPEIRIVTLRTNPQINGMIARVTSKTPLE